MRRSESRRPDRLPALDEAFVLADEQRGLRLQLEYAKAEQALRHWGVQSTVVVFGSARVLNAAQMAALEMRNRDAAAPTHATSPAASRDLPGRPGAAPALGPLVQRGTALFEDRLRARRRDASRPRDNGTT
jgi:hypothetical protein